MCVTRWWWTLLLIRLARVRRVPTICKWLGNLPRWRHDPNYRMICRLLRLQILQLLPNSLTWIVLLSRHRLPSLLVLASQILGLSSHLRLVCPEDFAPPSQNALSEPNSSYSSLSLPAQPVADDSEAVGSSLRSKTPLRSFLATLYVILSNLWRRRGGSTVTLWKRLAILAFAKETPYS